MSPVESTRPFEIPFASSWNLMDFKESSPNNSVADTDLLKYKCFINNC